MNPDRANEELQVGTRLGPYEILAGIGKGGMGEVYRAHDTRLGRDVAIKISAQQFTERFQREAKATAALNHPNVCHLYDVGPNYFVMELVEGPTLAERVKERPIPLEEALGIARQIADGLEAAHERGITHRDLKPGNIKIKPDGTVKVLDFGLAKMAPLAGAKAEDSPTLTLGMTQAGVIVGTAAYMAPEQARGLPVDKRADIWAFGVVLYEMLTGKRLFTGETVTDILAAVVKNEPDLELIPSRLRRLLKACLEKDPRKRLRDIGDAMSLVDPVAPVVVPPTSGGRRGLLALLAGVMALLAFASGAWWRGHRESLEPQWEARRLGGSDVATGPRISPDGKLLAFQAMVDGITQVAVMTPDSGNWVVLTKDRSRNYVEEISWSPDSTKLYFSRKGGGIYSIPALGGEERLILENAGYPEALKDGSLLFSRVNPALRREQIYRLWPETGKIQPLPALPVNPIAPGFRPTPQGDKVVFLGTPLENPSAPDRLYSLDLASGKTQRLAPDADVRVIQPFPLAVSADGRSALFNLVEGDLPRIVSAPLDGSRGIRRILTLTSQTGFLDVSPDGSLYLDQWDRPREILRFSPNGGIVEHLGEARGEINDTMPIALPDGQVVYGSRTGGRERLLVVGTGKDSVPFLDTEEETAIPAAVAGNQVAFMIGQGANRTIGFSSFAGGRVMRRLGGTRGTTITSLVASPDGATLYYTANGSVWTIPASDGRPEKLRAGDSVTMDPTTQDLLIRVDGEPAVHMIRVSLKSRAETPVEIQKPAELVSGGAPLSPAAVAKDGRILIQVSLGAWFWPAGILDPRTGRVQKMQVGYDADMPSPGWTADGKIVVIAEPLRASLWKFRPAEAR